MIGNIFLHALAMSIDIYQHSIGFVSSSGLFTGVVVHLLLIIGFSYYLSKMDVAGKASPSPGNPL